MNRKSPGANNYVGRLKVAHSVVAGTSRPVFASRVLSGTALLTCRLVAFLAGGMASSQDYPPHVRLRDEQHEEDAEEGSFKPQHSSSPPTTPGRRVGGDGSRQKGFWAATFSNTFLLWRLAFPFCSFANVTLLIAALMTVVAQIGATQLPIYVGRTTKELTGGVTGLKADKAALSFDLSMAFACIVAYVALRGATQLLAMLLGMHWRLILLRKFQRLYLSPSVSYRIKVGTCDSFDQRITSDLSTFIKLCCGGVSPPLESVYVGLVFDVFLISTTAFLTVPVTGAGSVFYAILYNTVTIGISVLFSIPIVSSTAIQENLEGEFRIAHMRCAFGGRAYAREGESRVHVLTGAEQIRANFASHSRQAQIVCGKSRVAARRGAREKYPRRAALQAHS